jgi:hypothetical protein
MHRRFKNLGGFILGKHLPGHRFDPVNISADVARHDLISAIRGLNAGVTLHAKARIGTAV